MDNCTFDCTTILDWGLGTGDWGNRTMVHNVEVKIECKGDAAGPLGWFSVMMERSEFVIKNGKNGSPAMFLKTTS